MRLIAFVLVLMLAAVPAAQAQQIQAKSADHPVAQTQLVASGSAPAPNLRPVDTPIGFARSEAALATVEFNRTAEKRVAFQDPSARNVLAIVGAVVIVVALIVLLK